MTTAIGSKLDPVLQLIDNTGQIVVESTNGVLGYACAKAGTYAFHIAWDGAEKARVDLIIIEGTGPGGPPPGVTGTPGLPQS